MVKTPCVGICSCTLGDDVCRGCVRTADEVRDWNGYTDSQKIKVLDRLKVMSKKEIKPCACGDDPVIFKCDPGASRIEQMTTVEKIECPSCGNIVWGSDQDSIDDWNAGAYD